MAVDYVRDMKDDTLTLNESCKDARFPRKHYGRVGSRFARKPEPEPDPPKMSPALRKAALLGLTAGLSAVKFILCVVAMIIAYQLRTNENAQTFIVFVNGARNWKDGDQMLAQATLSMPTALVTFVVAILTFKTYPKIPNKMLLTHTWVQVILFFLDVAIIGMTFNIDLTTWGEHLFSFYLVLGDLYSISLTQWFLKLTIPAPTTDTSESESETETSLVASSPTSSFFETAV